MVPLYPHQMSTGPVPASPTPASSAELLAVQIEAGRPRAIGRAISWIENGLAPVPDLIRRLAPHTGRAYVVGLTGPPGVGKSTTTTALVAELRRSGRRVGVLAVDPTSPVTGGALLGDRVRMQEHALDAGVYIRSMATRGHLGGLAVAAPQALRVYDAAGFDVVLLETVGVGQSEIDVAAVADVTVVLVAPGAGDGIQLAKAGLLETGDLFVVNKADRPGGTELVQALRAVVPAGQDAGRVLTTVATTGEGVPALVAGIEDFRRAQHASGAEVVRRTARARREVEALALAGLHVRLAARGKDRLVDLAEAVRTGVIDPYAAAAALTSAWGTEGNVPGS